MGFYYTIQCKSGVQNVVVDTLSRVSGSSLLLMNISHIQSDLLQLIEQSWSKDPHLQLVIQEKQIKPNLFPNYQLVNDQLKRNRKLVVGSDEDLWTKLLQWVHTSPQGVIQAEMLH